MYLKSLVFFIRLTDSSCGSNGFLHFQPLVFTLCSWSALQLGSCYSVGIEGCDLIPGSNSLHVEASLGKIRNLLLEIGSTLHSSSHSLVCEFVCNCEASIKWTTLRLVSRLGLHRCRGVNCVSRLNFICHVFFFFPALFYHRFTSECRFPGASRQTEGDRVRRYPA